MGWREEESARQVPGVSAWQALALGEGTVVGEGGVMAREGGATARFCGMEKGRHQKDYSS